MVDVEVLLLLLLLMCVQVTAVCGSDSSCSYDYMVTGSQAVALDTKAMGQTDAYMRTMAAPGESRVSRDFNIV